MKSQIKRTVVDATSPLTINISEEDVSNAIPKNPNYCVIACTLKRTLPVFEQVEVGSTVVKIFTPGQVFRYATSHRLSEALKVYDETGVWELPPGPYVLGILPPSARIGGRKSRWNKYQGGGDGSGMDKFSGRKLPTRSTIPVHPRGH